VRKMVPRANSCFPGMVADESAKEYCDEELFGGYMPLSGRELPYARYGTADMLTEERNSQGWERKGGKVGGGPNNGIEAVLGVRYKSQRRAQPIQPTPPQLRRPSQGRRQASIRRCKYHRATRGQFAIPALCSYPLSSFPVSPCVQTCAHCSYGLAINLMRNSFHYYQHVQHIYIYGPRERMGCCGF
jgi:hypothetical protein